MSVDEGLPPVPADAERISLVLWHLLDNAVKYREAGSVTLAAMQRGNAVEVMVYDSGPGGSAEQHKLIFDHFPQLGDIRTGKPQGLGLGLALCQRIVELHNGRIGIESVVDQGSVFYVTLPLAGSASD